MISEPKTNGYKKSTKICLISVTNYLHDHAKLSNFHAAIWVALYAPFRIKKWNIYVSSLDVRSLLMHRASFYMALCHYTPLPVITSNCMRETERDELVTDWENKWVGLLNGHLWALLATHHSSLP